jgi:hypothetical protein
MRVKLLYFLVIIDIILSVLSILIYPTIAEFLDIGTHINISTLIEISGGRDGFLIWDYDLPLTLFFLKGVIGFIVFTLYICYEYKKERMPSNDFRFWLTISSVDIFVVVIGSLTILLSPALFIYLIFIVSIILLFFRFTRKKNVLKFDFRKNDKGLNTLLGISISISVSILASIAYINNIANGSGFYHFVQDGIAICLIFFALGYVFFIMYMFDNVIIINKKNNNKFIVFNVVLTYIALARYFAKYII